MTRNLIWKDCLNVRDLGGLRTRSGSETCFNSLFRADSLDRLTSEGAQSLQEAGVKTIIDLRHEREISDDGVVLPVSIQRIWLALEDENDREFWEHWQRYNCTPFYYPAFLQHSAATVAAVISAIGDAPAGGVVFHCASGRDRTGLIAMLLLALAAVNHDEIVSDYQASAANLRVLGNLTEEGHIADLLAAHETTMGALISSILQKLSVESYLLNAGVDGEQILSIKKRLLGGQPNSD